MYNNNVFLYIWSILLINITYCVFWVLKIIYYILASITDISLGLIRPWELLYWPMEWEEPYAIGSYDRIRIRVKRLAD